MRSRADGANALGRASVPRLDGTTPFVDDGAPILVEEGGASDAHVHADAEGRRFAFFRRHRGADAIAMRELVTPSPAVASTAASVEVLRPTEPWEGGNVEAPWLLRHDGRYFLFYSAGRYCDGTYAIGVARASAIGGPYEKHPRPLVHSGTSTSWVGPGHASVFVGPRGVLTMAFHAYRTSEGAPRCESTRDTSEHDNDRRHAWLRAIEIVDGWPRLKGG
jgi:beta-xylosidase